MNRRALSSQRLLAALQGDWVRFASQLSPGGLLVSQASYACADFETLWDAICHHLWRQRLDVPSECALVLSRPVHGDEVRPGPPHWAFSARALRSDLGLRRLILLSQQTPQGSVWQDAALLALDAETVSAPA